MAKEDIKKILESTKSSLVQDYDDFVKSIKSDLESFKKTMLEKS
jgi:ATP-dependent protease HslVU (ClpYQ) ATPase subunit